MNDKARNIKIIMQNSFKKALVQYYLKFWCGLNISRDSNEIRIYSTTLTTFEITELIRKTNFYSIIEPDWIIAYFD